MNIEIYAGSSSLWCSSLAGVRACSGAAQLLSPRNAEGLVEGGLLGSCAPWLLGKEEGLVAAPHRQCPGSL